MNIEEILINIQKFNVISFDIFDTLVERVLMDPTDVFLLMENDPRVISICCNFSMLRMQAERQARVLFPFKEEITIKEIYDQLGKLKALDKEDLLRLENIEIETELRVLRPRHIGKQLYEFAVAHDKPILLTSDMYLPESAIAKILKENGFSHWDRLYLSSSEGKTKQHFSLFREILNSYSKTDILHIGDNYNSDYQNPRALGISSIYLPNLQDLLLRESNKFIDLLRLYKSTPGVASSLLLKHILSSDKGRSFPSDVAFSGSSFEFGRGILGALAFMFAHWLKRKCEELNIRNLLFLSRDGKLFHDAFKLLFPDTEINIQYVFASRKNNKIINRRSVDEILSELMSAQGKHDLVDIMKYQFGFTDSESQELLNHGQKKIDFRQLAKEIFKKVELMRQSYFEYLRGSCNSGEIAIVDIGYMGSTQKTISELLDKDVFGFYLSVDVGIQENIKTGHFFSFIEEPQRDNSKMGIVKHRHIYETILCSNERSFVSMIKGGDRFEYRFTNFDEPMRHDFIQNAHRGALIGVKELSDIFMDISFYPNKIPMYYLDALLDNPNAGMIEIFNGLEFEDNKTLKVIVSKNKDFPSSMQLWKEGVLFKQGKTSSSGGKWRELYLFVENIVIRIFSSKKMYKKYRKNRIGYLLDSKSSILRYLTKL